MSYNSIFFGTIDSAAIEAQITAQYAALTVSPTYPNGRTPNPGDPEYMMIATIAYARVLALQDIERAGKCNLIQFATGANLDYLAKIIGLIRIDTGPSVTQIRFTLIPGHAQVIIPGGTLVSSSDGLGVYATNEDTLVPVGVNTVVVDVTCTTDGTGTNGYAIGTITTIQNPQPYLQTATNISVTSGGADVETDASFVARWYAALEALSVAGPTGAYLFYALSSSLTIVSVSVLGPEEPIIPTIIPGTVEIRILTDTGVPTQAILDGVLNACNPTTVRPCCDTVLAYGANPIPYDLIIGITAFIGANTGALPGLVQAAIQDQAKIKSDSIGKDVVLDALIEAGMLAGVKRLSIMDLAGNPFTDISVDLRSFAILNSISVTVIGTEAP